MNLMEWVRHIFLRDNSEHPPPLARLDLPEKEERRRQLDEASISIRHRERVLRTLEAKARVRGGGASGGNK